ncbi:MAG TPA: ABC transporter permease [Gemmatimonadales bacterium]|jgi:putative ABC transport system permease protein|nr:ABC transporter permease [Gemmatimonadales bacterium]
MLFWETILVALQSIRANKLRSALTALGIIIGVAAVITMVALGAGAQRAVEESIRSLGANVLSVWPGSFMSRGVATSNRAPLTTDDAEALRRHGTLIRAVVPEMQNQLQVKYLNTNINTMIIGATANYAEVKNYKIAYGRFFTAGDDAGRQRYAVLGADIPEMLGANPAALIHQTIQIRGLSFEVIGVLERKGATSGSWWNPDEQIVIPLQTARYRVFGSDRLRQISVQIQDTVPIEQGMVDIERVLRREHKIRPGQDNDFTIRNSQEILATQQATTQIFTTLLASIAAVSLVVGGIGIMNIMLVSVTERTREIGTRKALGATKINIMFQFLIEALVLCLSGGILGIGLGVWVSRILAKANGWNVLISPESVLISFGVSAAIGLVFGIWPASRAAKLDPIVALRYE